MRSVVLSIFAGLLVAACSESGGSSIPVHHEPQFRDIPAAWLSPANSLDMTTYWNAAAIPFGGMNYYLLPMPAAGNTWSERFNPDSPYFQTWIGIYTVKDAGSATYGIQNGVLDEAAITKLCIVDQWHWLAEFGQIPSPVVELAADSPITEEPTTIDGSEGWKVTSRLTTQTDTGNDNMQVGLPEPLIIPKSVWETRIASYQRIDLDVSLYVWHSTDNAELNVIYYNSTSFTDLDGTAVDTKATVSNELDAMARSITVR